MSRQDILIVDDEQDMLEGLKRILPLELEEVSIQVISSPLKALDLIGDSGFDLILMDVRMPEMDGIELLEKVMEADSQSTVIMMTAYGTIETAVQAIKMGAYDFITKPFEIPDLIRQVRKGLERSKLLRENDMLRRRMSGQGPFENIVGQSPVMKKLFATIESVAATDYSVLIRGESGTGKELVARAVHALSKRRNKPLISVNCPAIPEHLLESELFGHKKGAYTGALKDRKGFFVEAHGSSLLLDEIADIPVSIQTKLLRALQEREIRPLGANSNVRVDVRILSTTNQDLEGKIRDRSFREDLFYRLNVVSVTTPSLREIRDDIPLLVEHFNQQVADELDIEPRKISNQVVENLMHREWPGNTRELQNYVRRMIVFSRGEEVTLEDLGGVDGSEATQDFEQSSGFQAQEFEDYSQAKSRVINDFTERYVRRILERTGGNITRAARLAGLSRVALQKILRRLKVDPETYRQ